MSWFNPSPDTWFGGGAHAAAAQANADGGGASGSTAAPPKRIHNGVDDNTLAMMTHYELLGIHPEASAKDITKIWRDVARQWHPDKQHPADREFCTRRFQRMQQANEVLSDPKLRALYDEYLRVKYQDLSFDGSFDDFQAYAKHQEVGGQKYEDIIMKRREDLFQPSAEDLKLLALTTGSVVLSAYVLYKMFVAERLFLAHVPFFLQLDWIIDTLPTSFEVAITEMLLQAGGGFSDETGMPAMFPLPTRTERKILNSFSGGNGMSRH